MGGRVQSSGSSWNIGKSPRKLRGNLGLSSTPKVPPLGSLITLDRGDRWAVGKYEGKKNLLWIMHEYFYKIFLLLYFVFQGTQTSKHIFIYFL